MVAPGRRTVNAAVLDAVRSVTDPEYPDVSIVDLGLLESIDVGGGGDVERTVTVGLIPTFSGCPALTMIAHDVCVAVEGLDDVSRCDVVWLDAPIWSTGRMTSSTATRLAAEYTVVVRADDGGLHCPVCGGDRVEDAAMAGPTRCRSVAWCPDCRNPVEVMRSHAVRVTVRGSDGRVRVVVPA